VSQTQNLKKSLIEKKEYVVVKDESGNVVKVIFPHVVEFGLEGIESGIVASSNILPDENAVRSLGSAEKQWKDLYVSKGTIYVGGARIGLSESGKIQFRDEGQEEDTVLSEAAVVTNQSVINAIGFNPANGTLSNLTDPNAARLALGLSNFTTGTISGIFEEAPDDLRNSSLIFGKNEDGSIYLDKGSGPVLAVTVDKSDIGLGNVVDKSPSEMVVAAGGFFASDFDNTFNIKFDGKNPVTDDNINAKMIENAVSFRSNLGLGTAATRSTADFRDASWTPAITDLPGTIYHDGRKPSKSDVGLGNVADKSPSELAALADFTDNFRASSWTPGIDDLPGGVYHTLNKPSKSDVGLGNVVDKNPAQLSVDTAFTSEEFRGSIHSHFKNNDADWSSRGGAIQSNSDAVAENQSRLGFVEGQGRNKGKSRLGILDNGKMLSAETYQDSAGNVVQPSGWVTSRCSAGYSGLGYEDATNKVAKLSLSNNDLAIGILSPAFELKEDAYSIKIRMKTSFLENSIYPLLYIIYTTDSNIEGEYITNQYIYPTEPKHATNITYKYCRISGTNNGSLTKVSGDSSTNNSFSVYEYRFVPPEGANWASLELYKAEGELYIDWISIEPDTKYLRPTATSLNLTNFVGRSFSDIANSSEINSVLPTASSLNLSNFVGKTLQSAYNDGRAAATSYYSSQAKQSFTRSVSTSDYSDLAINQDWQFRSSPFASYSFYNISAKLRFAAKDSSGGWVSRGYINDSGTDSTINFTGQHRCEDINDELSIAEVGLIVSSTGNYNNLVENDIPTINSALPIVKLSSIEKDKACFGVISDKEDLENFGREYSFGNFVTESEYEGDVNRLIINSLGEGAIWVTNINGSFENGDYITTSNIPGHGMKQDDGILRNYTVAKITQNCDFQLTGSNYKCEELVHSGSTYRRAFVGCTYHCG
jgi:hypothetical protein